MKSSLPTDWNDYAGGRTPARNRLLLEYHQEALQDFLSFLSNVDLNSSVLDIGCASGFFLTLLRELGFADIEGIDASEKFISIAREKGLRCRVMDILAPGLHESEKKFDIILLMEVLEHLPDPLRALENARKLFLKSNGGLFITIPLYDSIFDRVKFKRLILRMSRLEQSQRHDPTHIHAFTEKEFHALIERAGFEVVSSRRLHCPLPFIASRRARAALNLFLPSRLKGRFLRVVARQVAKTPMKDNAAGAVWRKTKIYE